MIMQCFKVSTLPKTMERYHSNNVNAGVSTSDLIRKNNVKRQLGRNMRHS